MSSDDKEIKGWDDFGLNTNLLRGIYAYGFETPSEIQKKTILPIINGKDIIAQAQSGSGKTGAFSISSLQIVDTTKSVTQALILAPTHELAKQIYSVIYALSSNIKGLHIKTIIGGTSIQQDVRDIRKKVPHIIIGCAGRIHDMIKRNHIDVGNLRILVLDEADEMLSKGFKEQIYNIFQFLNTNTQIALFSATMPEDIITLSDKFMNNSHKIIMPPQTLSVESISQYYIACSSDNAKFDMLKLLFSSISISQCIIYCNSNSRVSDLYNAMIKDGYSVCSIHGGMEKDEREKQFFNFRNGTFRVLISSNVTARGIDIQQVSTVINFDIPKSCELYLHKIGRSGRYGRTGVAINFVTKFDVQHMRKIEDHYKINIAELPSNFNGL